MLFFLGKGTRLAPLPAGENNNKPGVVSSAGVNARKNDPSAWSLDEDSKRARRFKIRERFSRALSSRRRHVHHSPFTFITCSFIVSVSPTDTTTYNGQFNSQKLPFGLKNKDGKLQSLTVLEAVVKQTGIYASSRKGRLSVFWGDQVFLPSAPFQYKPTHHADILCTLLGDTAPTAEEWVAQGLDKYGVIACLETDVPTRLDAAQVEKVSHATATEMLGKLGKLRQVGPSLGSFSVSSAMLKALTDEFSTELKEKTAKFDTDPHFWMPMTLSESDYVSLMEQKGVDAAVSKAHYERMAKMKAGFDLGDYGLFGAVDVGKDAKWWDYGQVKLYSKNSLLLLEQSASADLLRTFLGVDSHLMDCSMDGVTLDGTTYAFDSKIKSGSVSKSVISGVRAEDAKLDGAIVVNCAAKKIVAEPGAILYGIVDQSEDGIVAGAGEIKVAVTEENGTSMILESLGSIDGGKAWKQVVCKNTMSFEDVHKKNKSANIGAIQSKRQKLFDEASSSMGF